MSETHSQFQVRPRFKVALSKSPDLVKNCLQSELSQAEKNVYGTVIDGHATIHLPKSDQHYWSPQLTLSFEPIAQGTLLRGMYSPRPEVWTMFVLFYAIIGFAALIISVVGYSRWSIGQSAAIVWVVPVLLGVFLTLYLVSFFGQKMGRKQIVDLHTFVERALDVKI